MGSPIRFLGTPQIECEISSQFLSNIGLLWEAIDTDLIILDWIVDDIPRQEDLFDNWDLYLLWDYRGTVEWLPDYCTKCHTIRVDVEGGLIRRACSLCLDLTSISERLDEKIQLFYTVLGYSQNVANILLLHYINTLERRRWQNTKL